MCRHPHLEFWIGYMVGFLTIGLLTPNVGGPVMATAWTALFVTIFLGICLSVGNAKRLRFRLLLGFGLGIAWVPLCFLFMGLFAR